HLALHSFPTRRSSDLTRNFFELLKKDKMIITENLINTTRLTVCNYDIYQGDLRPSQTRTAREPNASQTQADPNNNDNNDNKVLEDRKSTRLNSSHVKI